MTVHIQQLDITLRNSTSLHRRKIQFNGSDSSLQRCWIIYIESANPTIPSNFDVHPSVNATLTIYKRNVSASAKQKLDGTR